MTVCVHTASMRRIIPTTHNDPDLLAGLQSLCIWCAPSLTALGLLHLTALTALTLLRAEGCNTVFGSEPAEGNDYLHLSSQVSRQTMGLAAGPPQIQRYYVIAFVQMVAVPSGRC
jgi:hypothetical protein